MAILLSAIVMGLLGSFHCAGMCGPIAISLPLYGESNVQKIGSGFIYNFGRVITYAILGALFGWLGQGIALIGFQQYVSVIMGSLMIISVLFPTIFKVSNNSNRSWFSFVNRLKSKMSKLFSTRSLKSLFFIGLLNGLLPCGLVYMAIAGSIGTGDPALGSLYMTLFGLGTIPMLLSLSILGNLMSLTVRKRVNKLIPFLVVIVGVLFILRGLSLGIPYLSPPVDKIEQKFEKSLKADKETLHNESKGDCCEEN